MSYGINADLQFKKDPSIDCLKFNDDPLAVICAYLSQGAGGVPEVVYKINSSIFHKAHTENKVIEFRGVKTACNIDHHTAAALDISNQDRSLADSIKKYYSRKLFLESIKGNPPKTPFRQTLARILSHYDDRIILEDELRILVKLPEFYEQDMFMEDLSTKFDTKLESYKHKLMHLYNSKTLKYINKLHIKTRREKIYRYFFSLNNSKVVVLNIQETNPLLSLLNKVLESNEIQIETGTLVGDSVVGTQYGFFRLEDWSI